MWATTRFFVGSTILAGLGVGFGCSNTILLGEIPQVDAGDADARDAEAGPWFADIVDVGEAGWADSTVPWSPAPASDPDAYCIFGGLWSQPGAVYVLMSWVTHDGTPESAYAFDVQRNEGAGWSTFRSDGCGVFTERFWDADRSTCVHGIRGGLERGLAVWPYVAWVRADGVEVDGLVARPVFVVGPDNAYALGEDDAQPVLQFDGVSWGPVPAVFPVPLRLNAIWADESRVAVVGEAGTLRVLEDGEWQQWSTGTVDEIYQVWGLDNGEIWAVAVGTQVLRCIDGTCTSMDWPALGAGDPCGEGWIQYLWGADDTLFLATEHELVRWNGSGFDVIGYWPATYVPDPGEEDCRGGGLWIRALWGNSPTEVFVVVDALGSHTGNCADDHVLRWDGTEFHWF